MTQPLAAPPEWLTGLIVVDGESAATQAASDPTAPIFQRVHVVDPTRPGDDWAASRTWDDLLTADGWTLHHVDQNGERHWTRPGKQTRDGVSATTGYTANDNLKVFTTSMSHAGLNGEETYTKLGYWAATRYQGDHTAAARALAADGWGRQDDPTPSTRADSTPAPTGDDPWPEPIPLGADADLPPFPLHVLPEWITDHVIEVAADLQVPQDLPATLALGTLSTLAAGHLDINVHGRWREDTNLFLVVAMPPSTGKSPAYKAMCFPVATLEAEYARQVRAQCAANASLVANLEGKIKRATQMDSLDADELTKLHEELFTAQEKPTKPPKLTVGDATPEMVEKLIADNHGRLAIHSTEGGVFGLMTGRYTDSSNLDVYLQGWSGDKIETFRIGRESVVTPKALLTMVLTVQPSVIAALAEKPELAGRGLTARFMYSMPRDVLGARDLRFYAPPPPEIADTYASRMLDLGRRFLTWQVPAQLNVEWEAAEHYSDWRQGMEARRIPGGDLRPLAEWTGKLESSVLRVAALLHVANGYDINQSVTLGTIAQAIQIGEYWLAHASLVHDLWGTSDEIRRARTALAWVAAHDSETFTVRDMYRELRTQFPTSDAAIAPLTLLVERGWIRTEAGGPVVPTTNGRSTKFTRRPGLSPASVHSVQPVPRDGSETLPSTQRKPRDTPPAGQAGQSPPPGETLDALDDY